MNKENVKKLVLDVIEQSKDENGNVKDAKVWQRINQLENSLFYNEMIDYQTQDEKDYSDVLNQAIKILRNLFY